jgi:glycosyltransferase involved in cell wall biosynthesis
VNRRTSRIANVAPEHPLSELEPELVKRGVLMPLLSVVVPVNNQAASILPFVERISAILDGIALNQSWEILFVDDGSTDGTLAAIAAANQRERRVRALSLSRSFGKESALSAGLDHARGRAVIPMHADMRDPPEVLPEMVGKWLDGYEMVFGVRRGGIRSALANRLGAAVSDFNLIDRNVVEVVRKLPERSRSMTGLCAWAGFKQATVEYDGGASRAALRNVSAAAFDRIVSASTVPLRMWSYLGAGITLSALAYACLLVFDAEVFDNPLPDSAAIIFPVLFLGGIQLIALGVLGEYVGRILMETKQRPLYVVRETVGIDATAR